MHSRGFWVFEKVVSVTFTSLSLSLSLSLCLWRKTYIIKLWWVQTELFSDLCRNIRNEFRKLAWSLPEWWTGKSKVKSNSVLVTDRAGLYRPIGCEMSRLPHFLDNRIIEGGLTRRPLFITQKHFLVLISFRDWLNPRADIVYLFMYSSFEDFVINSDLKESGCWVKMNNDYPTMWK
jgi:hypothetical protein